MRECGVEKQRPFVVVGLSEKSLVAGVEVAESVEGGLCCVSEEPERKKK